MKYPESCAYWQELLTVSHPEIDLSPSERTALEAHLADCSKCSARDEQYRAIEEYLRAEGNAQLASHSPPPLVWLEKEMPQEDERAFKEMSLPLVRQTRQQRLWSGKKRSVPVSDRFLRLANAVAACLVVASLILASASVFALLILRAKNTPSKSTSTSTVTIAPGVPTVGLGPVCMNDLGVALNGIANWQGLQPGTITLSWGDGSPAQTPFFFPTAHTYSKAGTYTVSAAASDSAGSASTALSVTVGAGVKTCSYAISPQPIANGATISPGQHINLTITVTDAAGQPLPGAPVWLWFQQASGGGTASACCYAEGVMTPQNLTQTPLLFVTGVNEPAGQVAITYVAPAVLPLTGVDAVVMQNAPTAPTVSMQSSIG